MRLQEKPRLSHSLGAFISVVLAAASWSADEPVRMSGGGGYPLTPSVTSMWGAAGELVVPGKKPLTFMIYFSGEDGWHQRKWEAKQQWKSSPFFVEFSSDLVTLRAEMDAATRTLSVFGQSIDLAQANVVLVEHVDRPGEEVVTGLGRVDLASPEDSNPAAWVLENNEAIRSRVVGTGK